MQMVRSWKFVDDDGSFEIESPNQTNYLYFPLVNEAGMMSVVSPMLQGDIKAGQHEFLTPPVSVGDLITNSAGRKFWLRFSDGSVWSAAGNSLLQNVNNHQAEEVVSLRAGFLWHELTRENKTLGIRSRICNFVPPSRDKVELMRVRITNISDNPISFSSTAALPMYARSADNLRDHRHVTSLLNKIECNDFGVAVKPTLSFDERGHKPNQTTYLVIGVDENGTPPIRFTPVFDDFVGEGGNMNWPDAVVLPAQNLARAGDVFEGYEAVGSLHFAEQALAPGGFCDFYLVMGIFPSEYDPSKLINKYSNPEKHQKWLKKTKKYWNVIHQNFSIQTRNQDFDLWMKWVSVQPTLRRLFGNSFLPYHDYGRGGRGWRDLWQDILALMITQGESVESLLFGNFAGIRLDGSNATIIGDNPGEFKADRNNIPRIWMDHGAWPLLTILYYIDQSGDLEFLLREQEYFKDHLVFRSLGIDEDWDPTSGTTQLTSDGKIYMGTVLEHLLIQPLTAFFNTGENNLIRLEGADWNDGLDMADERGESVAFSALYAGNLSELSKLVRKLGKLGVETVELAKELETLLDSLQNQVDYDSTNAKQRQLQAYLKTVSHTVSGEKVLVPLEDLANDLKIKADWLKTYISKNEWITNQEGFGWFNGYYDNDGQQLEGDHPLGVRMTLTGQVFTLMCRVADDEQAVSIIQAAKRYLLDTDVGGYRLNTNFFDVLTNMGRLFGFAFGHKENGAMFSHMAVMYAYALYERGFASEGYQVLKGIFEQSINFPVSRMYPGVPEYFDARGRGVYPYLTGAASWYIFTLLTMSFGVRGSIGDLEIDPKLVRDQFGEDGKVSIRTRFADRDLWITFHNPLDLEFGAYSVGQVIINGEELPEESKSGRYRIPRSRITSLKIDQTHCISIILNKKTDDRT
jgi:cellobiose phosphorylase